MEMDNKQERIRFRRQRIEARELARARAENGDDAESPEQQESVDASAALQALNSTIAQLDEKKLQTVASVTDIRVLADRRERERRSKESERSQARDRHLQDETLEASKAHGAAVMRWGDIMERQLPQELADELASQQSACAGVLERKEKVIGRLEQELRGKEDEYLKALAAQKEDITSLLARMKAQFEEMRDSYEQALVDVENSFLGERGGLLAQQRKEIDALFDARKAMEAKYTEERLEREEQWANDLYDMQAADLENYARLKAKLEGDVSILEQQLEHMKFTYMLNIEKLEYNYRVLSERDSENKANLASQKARLARLRHALQKIQADYETADVRYRARNDVLTGEYQRLTKQYRELMDKFKHFESSDAAVYAEVARVHEDEMRIMADRLVAADKVITEQLLGFAWEAPSVRKENMEAEAAAAAAAAARAELEGKEGQETAVDAAQLRAVLLLLISDCGHFLMEAAVQQSSAELERSGKRDEAEALKGDAVLKAIGATSSAAVASLCEFFNGCLQECGAAESHAFDGDDARGAANRAASGHDAPRKYGLSHVHKSGVPLLPLGFSTANVLKEWMESRKRAAEEAGLSPQSINQTEDVMRRISSATQGGGEGGKTMGTGTLASKILASGSAVNKAEEEARWAELLSVVPDTTVGTWKALEKGMLKYYKVVTKRSELLKEVESLRQANMEVRALLAHYLSSPASVQLQVPPTRTVKLGPATAGLADVATGYVDPAEALGVSAAAAAHAAETLSIEGGTLNPSGRGRTLTATAGMPGAHKGGTSKEATARAASKGAVSKSTIELPASGGALYRQR